MANTATTTSSVTTAAGGVAVLYAFDIHYERDSDGSRQEYIK